MHNRRHWQHLTDKQFAQLNEEYPIGMPLRIDDNICECEWWTIGDRRCDCGNRRIDLTFDDGYFYPEAY